MIRNTFQIFLTVLVFAIGLLPPHAAYALPVYSVETLYFEDCYFGYQVGYKLRDCNSQRYEEGTEGYYKKVVTTHCQTGEATIEYFKDCGGTWYPTSPGGSACLCHI